MRLRELINLRCALPNDDDPVSRMEAVLLQCIWRQVQGPRFGQPPDRRLSLLACTLLNLHLPTAAPHLLVITGVIT